MVENKTKEKTLAQKLNRVSKTMTLGFLLIMDSLIRNPDKDGQKYDPTDVGINEQTINEKGEVIKTIRRRPYSDITVTTKKGVDGMEMYTETLVKQPDGTYKIVENAPIVRQFRTKW